MSIIRFIALLLVALLAGTMFGILIGLDPAGLSAAAYVEQQQNTIRALDTLMPLAAPVCIVLAIALAVLTKRNARARCLFLAAAACLVVAAAVTRVENQPINAQVITWDAEAPPENWEELRDEWRHWHAVRTFSGLGALSLLIVACAVQPNPGERVGALSAYAIA